MFNGKLNEFCKTNNAVVREKGFWDSMHLSLSCFERPDSGNMNDNKEYKATKDAFISQKVALIMSECAEALEAMRKDNYGLEKKDSFEDEIADVYIRLSDLCGELDIDIEKQIMWKLNHNKSREKLHGKSF